MEADGFTQFRVPEENSEGKWYISSVEQDFAGFYPFLAHDYISRPYVTTIDDMTSVNHLIYDTFEQACEELKYYYNYHGASEMYVDLMSAGSHSKGYLKDVVKSQVMNF